MIIHTYNYMSYKHYTPKSFLTLIQSVVNELGYFPSEGEYRKFRTGKNLPMPKVSSTLFGLTWAKFGEKYFSYIRKTSRYNLLCCKVCNQKFERCFSQISQSTNHFCSRSCAGTYTNQHRKTGTRRSKLEYWLESQLVQLYPNLTFVFNQKFVIGSELDIYLPDLKLAFELNGIFHYEPIFGEEKLQKMQQNDNNKFQLCQQRGISLCVIDTSSQKYFKVSSSQKYLTIICNIIDSAR